MGDGIDTTVLRYTSTTGTALTVTHGAFSMLQMDFTVNGTLGPSGSSSQVLLDIQAAEARIEDVRFLRFAVAITMGATGSGWLNRLFFFASVAGGAALQLTDAKSVQMSNCNINVTADVGSSSPLTGAIDIYATTRGLSTRSPSRTWR